MSQEQDGLPPPPQPPPQHGASPLHIAGKNVFGISAFVSGIVGSAACPFLFLPTLMLGVMAFRKERRDLAVIGIALGLLQVPILVTITIPGYFRSSTKEKISNRIRCQTNLSNIQGAKSQWEIDENVQDMKTTPTWEQLVGEDKYIRKTPICPEGGIYMMGDLDTSPSCSLSVGNGEFNHTMPARRWR